MIAIVLSWILLFAIFWALGDGLQQVFKRVVDKNCDLSVVNTFFVGLCVGQIMACLLSLFLPLSKFAFLAVVVFAVVYWIINRRRLGSIAGEIQEQYISLSLVGKIVLIFFSLVVLYHSSSKSSAPDEFLYHLQSIKWMQEYGIVKGLANLHTRFGFNSSALSLFGLFAFQPELKISFTSLNGLCLLVFSTWSVGKIFSTKNTLQQAVYTIALVVMIHFFAMELSSTSTDIIVNILVVYLILNCIFVEDIRYWLLPLAVLPVLCVTLKLSSTPIALISLYLFWHLAKEKKIKHLAFMLTLSALITIPWIVQNVILSGYIVFPFPSIDIFSFDWKVPIDIVTKEKEVTYNWARGIQEGIEPATSFAWVSAWYAKIAPINRIIYFLSAISTCIFLVSLLKMKYSPLALVAGLTAIIGNLFGFLTAPELRFSIGFAISTILISFPFIYQSVKYSRYAFLMLFYVCIALFAYFHTDYIAYKVNELSKMEPSYLRSQLVKPFPVSYAKSGAEFNTMQVGDMQIYVPQNGLCYDYSLPCSPYVTTNLELRGKGLSDGFRVKQ